MLFRSTEYESKRLLATYAIPTVETVLARTVDEAVAVAERIGYPAVLKLNSESITHKTDVGGVRLNLASAGEVRAAYEHARRRKLNFDAITLEKNHGGLFA